MDETENRSDAPFDTDADLTPGLPGRRLTAVVNVEGGGCSPDSARQVETIFAENGVTDAEVVSANGETIEPALADAAAKSDVVVVLGGDGTIRTAAIVCGKAGKLIVPLAGGTLNMLPHALYGTVPWEKALIDTLMRPRIRVVSGGDVGGQNFFCAAVLGAPSLWADTREALRHGDVVQAAEGAVNAIRHHSEPLSYRLGAAQPGEAEAVVVICPLVSKALASDEQVLEASALDPVTALGMLGLAFNAIFSDWRNDPSVTLAKVDRVRVWSHGRIPAILDGERATFRRSVTVSFVRSAFRALVPAELPP
jgi:diacylglycerol kinase family enzyme